MAMVSDDDRAAALAGVQEGMKVVDAAGDKVGKVAFVKMGDPGADTAQGQEVPAGTDAEGTLAGGLTAQPEPDVALDARHALLRLGFVKIRRGGPFKKDVYASSGQIDHVEPDTVRLSAPVDELIPHN